MNPSETLPTPEKESGPQYKEVIDGVNESELAKTLELKPQAAKHGSGVISAVAVDDAQQSLQSLPGAQGATSAAANDDEDLGVDVPEVAEDVDLIEKEWVKKAKDIVNATEGDPYTQNIKINRMKVEYIKKRYNREVKIKDD